MTREEYNQSVVSIIELITANNAGSVARALKNAGYNSADFIAESDLKVALLQLHTTNPQEFYKVLEQVQWNNGKNNWTNDPQYRDPIVNAILRDSGMADISNQRGDWWMTVVGVLGAVFLAQGGGGSPQPTPEPKTPWGIYILVPLMIGAVIFTLWLGLKLLTPKPSK